MSSLFQNMSTNENWLHPQLKYFLILETYPKLLDKSDEFAPKWVGQRKLKQNEQHDLSNSVFSRNNPIAVYRYKMPMDDSLCLMRPTLPSLFLLCWIDTLQICTTTSHSSLAVRRLSFGPGSSLQVDARSCPSCHKEAQGIDFKTKPLFKVLLE